MADVMMAARIHATGNVEVELTDVVQIIEIVEAALDRFGNGNRLRVRERAEVTARAADDVRQQADVGRRDTERFQLCPERKQVRLANVGENQVLLVRNAELAKAVVISKVGDRVHLIGRHIARRNAGLLERQRDDGVARNLVSMHVALRPVGKRTIVGELGPIARVVAAECFVRWFREISRKPLNLFVWHGRRSTAQM